MYPTAQETELRIVFILMTVRKTHNHKKVHTILALQIGQISHK